MNTRSRIVHFFALVALVANMFAPFFTFENVLANAWRTELSQPTVSYQTPTDPGEGAENPPDNQIPDAGINSDGTGSDDSTGGDSTVTNTDGGGDGTAVNTDGTDTGTSDDGASTDDGTADDGGTTDDGTADDGGTTDDGTADDGGTTDDGTADDDASTDDGNTDDGEAGDDGSSSDDDDGTADDGADVPDPSVTTLVVPVLPEFSSTTCEDVTALFHSVIPASTPGILYDYSDPDADGLVKITATLESSEYGWAQDGVFNGWIVEGTVATTSLNAPACQPAAPKQVNLSVHADYEIDFSRRQVSLLTQELAHLAHPGDTLVITLTITNDGDAVDGVDISSSRSLSTDWTCEPAISETLEPGDVMVCTAEYLITNADMWSLALSFTFDVQPASKFMARGASSEIASNVQDSVSLDIDITSYAGSPSVGILNVDPRYADNVVSFSPGTYDGGTCPLNLNPGSGTDQVVGMLGAPDHPPASQQGIPDGRAPSLGFNGIVVLEFTDNVLVGNGIAYTGSGYGDSTSGDLMILERGSAAEPTLIEIFGTKTNGNPTGWITVGQLTSGSNALTQYFDIDRLLIGDLVGAEFTQVRLTDLNRPSISYTGCQSGNSGDGSPQRRNVAGADIDAVWAISSRVLPLLPTVVQEACIDGVQREFSWQNPPATQGVVYTIAGGSGLAGAPQPGDTIVVTAALATGAGYAWSTTINPNVWTFNASNNTYSHTITLDQKPCGPTDFPVFDQSAMCVQNQPGANISLVTQSNGFDIQSITADGNPVTLTDGEVWVAQNSDVVIKVKIKQGFEWPTDLAGGTLGSWVLSNPNDGTATLSFTATGEPCVTPDMAITKTASPTYALGVGQEFTYTLVVTNVGDGPAESVTVEDQLIPAGLSNWQLASDRTGCSISDDKLTCNFGTMQPGAAVTITLSNTVTIGLAGEATCGLYENTATVSASNEPTDTATQENNSDSDSITVACDDDKVWICHATSSGTNPYTRNHVPKSQIAGGGGHGSHEHDIWPEFEYNGGTVAAQGNQALLDEDDCILPMAKPPVPVEAVCRNGVVTEPTINFDDDSPFFAYSVDPSAPWSDGDTVTVYIDTIDGIQLPVDFSLWQAQGWTKVNSERARYPLTFEEVDCLVNEVPSIDLEPAVCVAEGESEVRFTLDNLTGFSGVSVQADGNPADVDVDTGEYIVPSGAVVVITATLADDYGWPTDLESEILGANNQPINWVIDQQNSTLTLTFTLPAGPPCEPELSIEKTVDIYAPGETDPRGGSIAQIGDKVEFTITVTNSGDYQATGVSFEDQLSEDLLTLSWLLEEDVLDCEWSEATTGLLECDGITVAAEGGTFSVSFSATITATSAEAAICGQQENTSELTSNHAIVEGEENFSKVTLFVECPGVTVTKTAGAINMGEVAPATRADVGDTVAFTITVTNSGNIPLEDFVLTDAMAPNLGNGSLTFGAAEGEVPGDPDGTSFPVTLSWSAASPYVGTFSTDIPVEGVVTIPVTYTLTQDDINRGDIENCVSIGGQVTNPAADCAGKEIPPEPDVAINKVQTDGGTFTIDKVDYETVPFEATVSPGQFIAYEITLTNTGNVAVSNFATNDEVNSNHLQLLGILTDDDLTCGSTTTPGLVWCDITSGNENLAPGETRSAVLVFEVVEGIETETCEVSNTLSIFSFREVGSEDYHYPPPHDENFPNRGPITVTNQVNCVDQWTVAKSSDVITTAIEVDDEIEYTITVTNTGPKKIEAGMVLNDVFSGYGPLTDWEIDGEEIEEQPELVDGKYAVTLPEIPLEGSITITATYTVTQEDVDAGFIKNCATLGEEEDCVTDDIDRDPSHLLTKSAGGTVQPGIPGQNQTIGFTVTLLNDGNVTIESAEITDTDLAGLLPGYPDERTWDISINADAEIYLHGDHDPDDLSFPIKIVNLPPDKTVTLTVSYTLTQEDIDAIELPETEPEWCKPWTNTASVSGLFVAPAERPEEPGTASNGDDPNAFESDSGEVTVQVNCTSLSIVKTAFDADQIEMENGANLEPGQSFSYQIVVTNNGDTVLDNIKVIDEVPEPLNIESVSSSLDELTDPFCDEPTDNRIECGTALLPGNWDTDANFFTITINVSVPLAGDIELDECGPITNIASIDLSFDFATARSGITPPGTQIDSNEVTHNIVCAIGFEVEKISAGYEDMDSNGRADADDVITYTFKVRNTGDVTLYNVNLTDSLPDVNFPANQDGIEIVNGEVIIPTLLPYDSDADPTNEVDFIGTYIIKQSDLDATHPDFEDGFVYNCVDAVANTHADAEDEGNRTVEADQACDWDEGLAEPDAELQKESINYNITPGDDEPAEFGFNITFTNTGNVTIDEATLTDTDLEDLLPAGTEWTVVVTDESGATEQEDFPFTISDLAPGKSVSIKVSTVIDPDDIELPEIEQEYCGSFENTAIVTGEYKNGAPVGEAYEENEETHYQLSSTDWIWVECVGLTIEKSSNTETTTLLPGDDFTYTIVVTNLGNTAVQDLVVEDDVPSQLEITGVRSSIDDPGDEDYHCEVQANNHVECDLGILNPYSTEGDWNAVTIEIDVKVPSRGEILWEQCGGISNFASITDSFHVIYPSSVGITPPETAIDSLPEDHTIYCETGLTVEKTSGGYIDENENGRADAGEEITYTFVVKNTGDVTLFDVDLSDSLPDVDFEDTITGLTIDPYMVGEDPDNSLTIIGTYEIKQSDLDATDPEFDPGFVENCVLVTGNTSAEPGENDIEVTSEEDCALDDGLAEPGVDAEKSAKKTEGPLNEGELVNFTITVTNTGNTTQTTILVSEDVVLGTQLNLTVLVDEAVGSAGVTDLDVQFDETTGIITITGTILPSATITIPVEYAVTQEDLDGGSIENCVGVVDDTNSEIYCVEVPLEQDPAFTVVKSAHELDMTVVAPNDRLDAGDQIHYLFVVKNTGNVTLYNFDLTDNLIVDGDWGEGGSTIAMLAPGESAERTAIYTIPLDVLDVGEVENCVVTTADGPPDAEPVPVYVFAAQQAEDDDALDPVETCITTELEQEPDVDLEKTGELDLGENDELNVGDLIRYEFLVTNTGNITLTGLELADPLPGLTWNGANTIASLAPGASVTLTATYAVTQADIDAGQVLNEAIVTTNEGPEDEDDEEVPLTQRPDVDLEKTGTLDLGDDNALNVGDVITYEFEITNTGNATLTNLELDDPLPGLTWDGENTLASLEPGASVTLTATYSVTQADIDASEVVNKAIVTTEEGPEDEDEVTVPLTNAPDVDLEKSGTLDLGADNELNAGDVITYEFEITNTGDATLTNLVLDDPLEGLTWDGENTVASLASGESVTLTASYVVTEADITAGKVVNEATVTADQDVEDTDDDTIPLKVDPPDVTDLPSTGHGSVVSTASVLWAASLLSVLALGTAAFGVRRFR